VPAIVERAFHLAYDAHQGKYREARDPKADKVPYIVHPVGVALIAMRLQTIVDALPDPWDEIIAVCLTHDTLEDTNVARSILETNTSQRVCTIVDALSKPARRPGMTRKDRNTRFLEQIRKAGDAAIFVKICDSAHNLSRPAHTPADLMNETILKAEGQYLPLIDCKPSFEKLKAEYLKIIEGAKRFVADDRRFGHSEPVRYSLEEALDYCRRRIDGKTLEIHDICAILQRICRANSVGVWTIRRNTVAPYEAKGGTIREQDLLAIGELPRVLNAAESPAPLRLLFGEVDSELILSVHSSPFDVNERLLFVIGVRRDDRADWATPGWAQITISYLLSGLTFLERERRSHLVKEIARLQLGIPTELLHSAGLAESQLVSVRHQIDFGAYVHDVLQRHLEFLLSEISARGDWKRSFHVSSRVKSAQSIVEKIARYGFSSVGEIEDLVGFRVTCPDLESVRGVAHSLATMLGERRALGFQVTGARILDYIEKPKADGYRSLHVLFTVDEDRREVAIGCEVQMRTYYQHAWAVIAHKAEYKRAGSSKETRRKLKQLQELGQQCDQLAQEISIGLSRKP
jgi:ppGpp synthetase/RelA/SpoT-type nucleotidyltranferase